jgi:HlyD family secretion protein
MKKLRIASIKSDLEDQEELFEVGGISNARIDKTKQELVFAEKDLEMILQKNSIRLMQLEVEENGLLLQITSQERILAELEARLMRMLVKAPSDGIILNVYAKEGEKVNEDKLLVSMSDLSTFKIIGFIDEKLADIIKTGGQVYAIVDNLKIPGQIGTIRPLIENNKIQFDVFLKESTNPKLISNLKVPLQVVWARKDSVLRIGSGPAFNDDRIQQVFTIDGNKAIRKQVETGLRGTDFIEITSGIRVGEKVICSDVSPFRLMKEVEIHNE